MSARVEPSAGLGGLETWTLFDGHGHVQVLPERGALVSRWRVGDDDVLFLDEATVVDRTKNVRGGVPLLFPNAGPLPAGSVEVAGRRVVQPQHGLARRLPWNVVTADTAGALARLSLRLTSSNETRDGFPFEFDTALDVSLTEGRLRLDWAFTNRDDVAWPLHAGLHPYFAAAVETKSRASVETRATLQRDRLKGDGPVVAPRFSEEVDVAWLDHGPSATLRRGDGASITLTSTPELSTLVLWTLKAQPFICVEPWTGPAGALSAPTTLRLEPGATIRLGTEFEFRR